MADSVKIYSHFNLCRGNIVKVSKLYDTVDNKKTLMGQRLDYIFNEKICFIFHNIFGLGILEYINLPFLLLVKNIQ